MYTLEVTEKQIRIMEEALEEYFRLRMGQASDFCDEMARIGRNLKFDDISFGSYINRREHLRELMRAFFGIALEPFGVLGEKTEPMLIAEDMWDAIKFATGRSIWDSPTRVSEEPYMRVTKHDSESD